MSSDTVDWLKKVTKAKANAKAKVSFQLDSDVDDDSHFNKKLQANAIYTAKDLTGLQVAHDFDSFKAGQSDILVFEDKSVLDKDDRDDYEGDSLISINLKEDSRLKRLREVARHAKGYSGFKAYEEESLQEDSLITLGENEHKKSKTKLSGKILQKYDYALNEFTDEPGVEGFILGRTVNVKKDTNEQEIMSNINDFDTVQSSGIDLINNFKKRNTNNLEKEQKRAKKLSRTLFSADPEMIVESEAIETDISGHLHLEDDQDLDMQMKIAATRREHLKNNPINLNSHQEIIVDEPKFVGGKSFDALIMSESIFTKPQESKQDTATIREIKEILGSELNVDVDGNAAAALEDTEDFGFMQEPLVRNGVASTLALLRMRGINLKARSVSNDSERNDSVSNVKLEYFDQFGNKLNSKEAYKELSRKFHGKEAGKGRLEKMKRKREETLKSEAVNFTSQSTIVTNLRRQQEETGVPFMVLSNTRHCETAPPTNSMPPENKKKSTKIFGLKLNK